MSKVHLILALAATAAVGTAARAGYISPDPRGIQISSGVVFVTPADAANNEGAVGVTNGNSASGTEGHVTVTFSNYWTTWSDTAFYGDIDAIMAVGPGAPGFITFTADPGYIVTIVSVDLVGSSPHGSPSIPALEIGSYSDTNISYNSPTHNTLVVNQSSTDGGSVVVKFTDTNGDYGWEGLNNIVFTEAPAAPVPEPASLSLLALSSLALLVRRRR